MINTYEDFKREFFKISDIDLNLYRENQMKRRIETLISKLGLSGYEKFYDLISEDKEKFHYFLDYITINVSDFFRTADQWSFMTDTVLKELCLKKKTIRAWSIACATGEEPYSLAISMMEKYPFNDIEIYATDINDDVLKKAENGIFSLKQMSSVSEYLREKYFVKKGQFFLIKDEVKRKIKFYHLDLLKFQYPKDFDLILARNVLIYFTSEAKDKAFRAFYESLKDDGYLFTGSTEQLIYYRQFGFRKIKPFLYQK